ncbi:MFS transporter [soil metagenome]
MSGTPGAGSYRALFRRPEGLIVARTFALAAVGRGGYAMLPLLLLFTVNQATDDFGTAALTLSLCGLATLSMPLKSRLVDRHGQRRVLIPLALALLPLLLGAAALGARDLTSRPAWLVLGVVVGLAAPPLGPAMRAQWRVFTPHELPVAYSLDAVTEEVLWLLGPLVAGAVLALGPAWWGLATVPVLILVGALGLGASPAQAAPPGISAGTAPDGAGPGPLRSRRLWPVLALMGGTGLAASMAVTGVAARAAAAGSPAFAAAGEGVLAAGAVAGGLAWGRWQRNWPWALSAGALLVPWAGLLAASAFVGLDVVFLTLFLLLGAVGSPLWVIAYLAADEAVAEHQRTEASTWVTTAANLGSSAGTAAAGALAAGVAVTTPAIVGALVGLAVALTAYLIWWRGRTTLGRRRNVTTLDR